MNNSFDPDKSLAAARLLMHVLPWCTDKRSKWRRRRDKRIWRYVEENTPKVPELTEEERELIKNNPY